MTIAYASDKNYAALTAISAVSARMDYEMKCVIVHTFSA